MEIGSNINIDRGAASDMTAGDGAKVNNQVQTGHNRKIGSRTIIAAETGISGSITIGNYCIIGGGVGTVGHIEIADKTTIDGSISATHSITESSQYLTGVFPMPGYKDQARNTTYIHRLSEMNKHLKMLEKRPGDSDEA